MNEVTRLAHRLPKAELHMHIEGSLEPEMMLALAERNRVPLPYSNIDEINKAYNFNCLQDFLDLYYQGMSVLKTEQDFHDLTWAYLQKCKQQNVVHCEIFFDPQGHTGRNIPFAVVIEGILAALEAAGRELNISSRLIMCFLRHLDEDSAFQTLHEAQPWLAQIAGVGLDSSEVGHPPSGFTGVFEQAAQQGLRKVAHAGEEGPPAYVREALDLLKVDRIDHGNRSLEDPELVARLATNGTPLTVCPLSNLRLAVVKDLRDHPVRRMLQAQLNACINSDDPSYFGGYVNENFSALIDALDLTEAEVRQLVENSFRSAFLPPGEIKAHLDRVESTQ